MREREGESGKTRETRCNLSIHNSSSIPSSLFVSIYYSGVSSSRRMTKVLYQVFCLSAKLWAMSMTVFSVAMGVQLKVVLALVVSMTFCLGSAEPGTPRTALGN